MAKLRVALIGQSAFACEVFKALRQGGHLVVGVFTIPDQNGKQEPVAIEAAAHGVPVFKFKLWRSKGQLISSVFEQYKSVAPDLNVLAYVTQFIPMEVITLPIWQSIVYHPSVLPRHRGASSINWTLLEGDSKSGFTVFWADDGLDTGPILLIEECDVDPNDTVDTLYNRFLFPEGVKGMARAVNLIAEGKAPRIEQSEEGATYDPMLNKKDLCKIDWNQPVQRIHNFIRGLDKVPGAWTLIEDKVVKLFGSRLWDRDLPENGIEVEVDDMLKPAIVHNEGLLFFGSDGKAVNVRQLLLDDGSMIAASKYGREDTASQTLELNDDERYIADQLKAIWEAILKREIDDMSDFFKLGAGSMDVVRLVEEVRERCNVELINEDVYMATRFDDFSSTVIIKIRGGDQQTESIIELVRVRANNRDISFPRQLFINNEFVDSESGRKMAIYNPTDESLICEVAKSSAADVDRAVRAAKMAFDEGEWRKINARDRGRLMYRLADLMEEHKEELATIESLDSGAVYTLALKTHVGMSIETFRYFAGWCDKIQGATIPINNARPNRNLSITKKEPIGVCGIITPWNYPLMMVSWKMAACLAAGNTVVLKPAQVSPLTALKLAELSVEAGFPRGVINILSGTGSECGQAIADHPYIRKLGFTGSTEIGKVIMQSCAASNLKKVSLELGGKSPLIIFADCDKEKAVRQALSSVFFNKGENCIAAGRLFIEESFHDEFVTRVVEETSKMVIGDPLDRGTHHGPQNHRAHLEKLLSYIETTIKEGAKLVYGGKQVQRPGLFLEPTIFTEVEDHMFAAKEESFGPIMIISKFPDGDVDGVLRRANASEFGLASGVFTRDVDKALYVSDKLEAGTVFVNTYNKTDVAAPFGGCKQSGFGKDLGEDALNEYLKTKCITFEY